MSNLIKSKRRINSIASTRKITNAMELIASIKLKRYKNIMENGNSYVLAIKEVMNLLLTLNKKEDKDITPDKNNKKLYIVINSNLGLCASYNYDIFKFLNNILNKDDEIIPIGLKGFNHFKNLSFKINENFVNLNQKINFDDINKFSNFILSEYKNEKYQEIYIVYMDYINTITFKSRIDKLLPLDEVKEKVNLLPPTIEPDAKTLLKELLPIYLSSYIYQAFLKAEVSEQASRRYAMENATDNADEMLDKLKLEYNKARQGAITQEITEVVSGANNN